jgi:hypothetical protein
MPFWELKIWLWFSLWCLLGAATTGIVWYVSLVFHETRKETLVPLAIHNQVLDIYRCDNPSCTSYHRQEVQLPPLLVPDRPQQFITIPDNGVAGLRADVAPIVISTIKCSDPDDCLVVVKFSGE